MIEQAANPIELTPIYYRTQTTGFGFTATTGDFIFRGETAYTDEKSASRGYDIDPWSWQSGLGVEKNWNIFGFTVTQVLYYFYGVFPEDASNLPTSGFRLFDNTAVTAIRWGITDDSYVYVSGLYEIPQEGLFLVAGYQRKNPGCRSLGYFMEKYFRRQRRPPQNLQQQQPRGDGTCLFLFESSVSNRTVLQRRS